MPTLFKISLVVVVLITSIITATWVVAADYREIYLTRHAEKLDDSSPDPSLSEKGKQRALNLANFLKSKNITAIYSTNYKRTMETAEATATLLNIKINHYDPSALDTFAEQLKKEKGNLLVVGHSNTTPELVTLLGGESGEPMVETEYDRVYQLQMNKDIIKTMVIKH